LVALMRKQAGENLVERASTVAEAEAVVWRDRFQLGIGEIGNLGECVAGTVELFEDRVDIDVRGVRGAVLTRAVVLGAVVLPSVAEGAEESGDVMPAVCGWLVGG
jgi:hypothetical protein